MKCNVGIIDRVIRLVIAIIFLGFAIKYSWWWIIVAVIAAFTGIAGWCGAYSLFGINTCRKVAVSSKKQKK